MKSEKNDEIAYLQTKICGEINDEMNNRQIVCLNISFETIKANFDVKFDESNYFFDIANEVINNVEILFLFFVLFKRCFNV